MLLQIATSDAQLPLEKNFDENLKLSDFKEKLFLITGIEPNDMSLSCNGKGLKDNVTLKELGLVLAGFFVFFWIFVQQGLTRGARIQVSDLSGNISKLTEDLESVEKYQISNEAYSKREDTFAKFRESKGIKGPAEKNVSDYPEVVVGKRCIIDGGHRGEICFFGNIENKPGISYLYLTLFVWL